ncbi:MAG: HD domain-containing protein [Bryobacteraceae bacterium]
MMYRTPPAPVVNALWERLRALDDSRDWPGDFTLKALIARWFFVRYERTILALHPQMTLHDLHHVEVVASKAGEIALKANLLAAESVHALSAEEIYYLLAACYLHDVGMGASQLQNDRAALGASGVPIDQFVRARHHERAERLIKEHARELYLDDAQASILGLLCKAHRSSELLGKPPYVNQAGSYGKPIRLPILAAILRIADELDLDYARAPAQVRQLWDHGGWFDRIARLHWLKHYYTLSTRIEATVEASVTLTPRITLRVPTGPGREYHIERVKALLREHLDREISSVRSVMTANFTFGDPVFDFREDERLVRRLLRRTDVRLLFVDDSGDYLYPYAERLRVTFSDLVATVSPLEAIALVTYDTGRFHAAIVDLEMAGLPGDESGKRAGVALLRNFSQIASEMALIANTGHSESEWHKAATDAGAHVVRTKCAKGTEVEVEAEDLCRTVDQALDLLGYDVEQSIWR